MQIVHGSRRGARTIEHIGSAHDDLDLEVLYVGQAYGPDGRRSASERLAKHETLQAIYGEAVRRSPYSGTFLRSRDAC